MNLNNICYKIIWLIMCCMSLIACARSADPVNNDLNEFSDFIPARPIIPIGDMKLNLREYADIIRIIEPENNDDVYNEYLKNPALTAVTKEFGYSVIKYNELPIKSGLAQADVTPWSSWWFPKKDKFLFDDSNMTTTNRDRNKLSPLSKYDLYRKRFDANANSASKFEEKNYDPNSKDWEGLCDAWAIASLLVPEPKRPVSLYVGTKGNIKITFNVTDLKGLLLKTFEAIDDSPFKYYGQKFTGDETGWIYPDIFPEQFHRFLEVQLFNQHKGFVLDTDPGVEIWNVPVFKANYTISAIPNEPNSVFVRTWIYTAESIKDSKEKSYVGTKEAVREYNYVLQGEQNANGELVVTTGYWVKGPTGIDSRHNHPDYLVSIPQLNQIVRKSWNAEIDNKLVDEILAKSY